MKKQIGIINACAILFMLCVSVLDAQNIIIKYIDTNQADAMAQLQKKAVYKPQKQCRTLSCNLTLYHRDQETNLQSIIKKAHSPIHGVNDVYEIYQSNYPNKITRIDYTLTGKDGFRKSGYIDLTDRSKFYDTEDQGLAAWNEAGADTICILADGSAMHYIYLS
jgi:hypothetical protein